MAVQPYRMHSESAKKMTSPSTLLSPATPSPGDAAFVPTTAVEDVAVAAAVVLLVAPLELGPEVTATLVSTRVQLAVVVVLQVGIGGLLVEKVVLVQSQSSGTAFADTLATMLLLLPLPAVKIVVGGCAAQDRLVVLARTAVRSVDEARMTRAEENVKPQVGAWWI